MKTVSVTDTAHCDDLMKALEAFRDQGPLIERWGAELARRLGSGGRLLVAGNGGSAAQAQHLTAELVGRYRDDRAPFSALALHADTSSTTAIANDYGVQEVFARQTAAHGRRGDVLMLLSTSGASANLLAAADRAHRLGMTVWALTGRPPNPLHLAADDALCVDAPVAATVQELHLVAVHMLCESFDRAVERGAADADAADADAGDGRGDGRPGARSRTDGRVDGRVDGRMDGSADGRVDGSDGVRPDGRGDGRPGARSRADGRVDGRMDGSADGRVDGSDGGRTTDGSGGGRPNGVHPDGRGGAAGRTAGRSAGPRTAGARARRAEGDA